MKFKVFIAIALLALISSLFLYHAINENQSINTHYEENRILDLRRSELELELKSLEDEYDTKINGIAHNYIVFTDFDPAYFDEIVEKMDAGKYKGHLVLREQNFPNEPGYLTLDQFNTLMRKGWDYCVLYETSEQFHRTRQLFEMNNMKCKTVYFVKDVYQSYMDVYLLNLGFNIAIHHGEAETNYYLDDSNSYLLHIACEGVMGDSPRFKMIDSVEQKGDFALTVGFKNEDELYSTRVFESLITEIQTHEASEELEITTFEKGYEYRMDVRNGKLEMMKQYEEKKKVLEDQIAQIDQEIKGKQDGE